MIYLYRDKTSSLFIRLPHVVTPFRREADIHRAFLWGPALLGSGLLPGWGRARPRIHRQAQHRPCCPRSDDSLHARVSASSCMKKRFLMTCLMGDEHILAYHVLPVLLFDDDVLCSNSSS